MGTQQTQKTFVVQPEPGSPFEGLMYRFLKNNADRVRVLEHNQSIKVIQDEPKPESLTDTE